VTVINVELAFTTAAQLIHGKESRLTDGNEWKCQFCPFSVMTNETLKRKTGRFPTVTSRIMTRQQKSDRTIPV